ncbi:MAG: oligosaccharide flippase family protein [Proteobacteria bacterium]|nr:oligosaccharide flippase family protein [Pseudomonadota bacterium]MBU1714532.1 oligosaccharide flippase family protein [Pseudomonadota bacterium]
MSTKKQMEGTEPFKRPSLRTNIIANLVGRASSLILSVVFTPVYLHFLGIEAYGLIGFFMTLQGSISFLEMGLSRACNRQLARLSGQGKSQYQEMGDTLRTLETVYWAVAIVIGLSFTILASFLASNWLNSDLFSSKELNGIIVIMAWVIALRWPVGLYFGAIMGLEQQVWLNIVQFWLAIVTGVGSVLVLWLIAPTIEIFFKWQLLGALFSVGTFVFCSWKFMPVSFFRAHFSLLLLKKIFPFAAKVGGNAVLGTTLMQADKLILSAILPLEQFGYYTLGTLIANATIVLADPISNAVFPRFSKMLAADRSDSKVSDLYHLSSQAVSVIVIPFALVAAFFSQEVLYAYTGKQDVAINTWMILSILVIAKMFHSNMLVPYSLQLASGWVQLSIYMNIASICWLLPAVYLFSRLYGAPGAAMAWLVVTVGYVFIGLPLMHKKLLVGEFEQWFTKAFAIPLVLVFCYLLLLRININFPDDRWLLALSLSGIGIGALAICLLTTQRMRELCLNFFTRITDE